MRIHPFPTRPRLLAVVITIAMLLLLLVPVAVYAHNNPKTGIYQQTNLVSDLPNIAKFQDPNLLNPWGLSHSPTSPWWVSDNGAGVSTLYNGDGTARLQVVLLELQQRQPATSSTARAALSLRRAVERVQAFSCLRLKTARSPAGTP